MVADAEGSCACSQSRTPSCKKALTQSSHMILGQVLLRLNNRCVAVDLTAPAVPLSYVITRTRVGSFYVSRGFIISGARKDRHEGREKHPLPTTSVVRSDHRPLFGLKGQ